MLQTIPQRTYDNEVKHTGGLNSNVSENINIPYPYTTDHEYGCEYN